MKKFQIILVAILLLVLSNGKAWATEQASESSAKLSTSSAALSVDNRAYELQKFLEDQDSPLAPYAQDFITSADRYQLDWTLLPAIAGLESSFGKAIPANSYNGWGWGIYGDNVLRFNSWPEAIETISKGIREGYLKDNPESNPYIIGPSYAASPTWAVRVNHFMSVLTNYRLKDAKSQLTLAL